MVGWMVWVQIILAIQNSPQVAAVGRYTRPELIIPGFAMTEVYPVLRKPRRRVDPLIDRYVMQACIRCGQQ